MKMQIGNTVQKSKHAKILKAIVWIFIVAGSYLSVAAAYRSGMDSDLEPSDIGLREKIEAYKKFKARYEDKDFQLDSYSMRRVQHNHGKSNTSTFNIYRITYGNIADNVREYDKSRKQIVQNPTNPQAEKVPACRGRRFVEDYTGNGPFLTCLEDTVPSYPIALILHALTEDELNDIAVIYEFDDGDVDIHFPLEKGRDKKFVESLYRRLQRIDEKTDKRRQAVEMEPIIPTRNQRLAPAFFDENKDGESDFVVIPYCINGSFFDDDPDNNSIQIALKYKLVTSKDLQGRAPLERLELKERIGLWMWDRPSEILTSFNDHPGPDIVFYDLGTVVGSRIMDAEPDGRFDKFEFLY
ncbi:MAG: hypothetical protein P8X90_26900 [Desulfobacterales bacterium]